MLGYLVTATIVKAYLTCLYLISFDIMWLVGSDQLWGGVTSVSAAGRKRGRTKSVKRRINLNIGQKIGYGNVFMCGEKKLQFGRKIKVKLFFREEGGIFWGLKCMKYMYQLAPYVYVHLDGYWLNLLFWWMFDGKYTV